MEEAKQGSEEIDEARNPRIARKPIAPTKAMRCITQTTASGATTAWQAKESVTSTRPLLNRKTVLLSSDSTMLSWPRMVK